ncbi:MAG: penicillin acylase family protein [Anaerolineae bacterium]|jgi:penicillin amidase
MSKRWTVISASIAALASLAGAGYYWLLRRPLARTQGTQRLSGLQDEVQVYRDRWGVPHIYAANEQDLIFGQGFVHAQDRLWQMDFSRRLVAGRLSEVLGEVTLPLDRWMRILGMRRVAEQEIDLLSPETRASLETYAAGVNARIAQGRLPVEFSVLRAKPEPWTVADSVSWIKFMSWTLSVNWESELLRAQLIRRIGAELAAELEPDYPDEQPRIVPPGEDLATLAAQALGQAEAARPFTGPAARDGLGSNSWVLSGERTASGAPLLANDMHLPIALPAIWYENHLVGGDLNVTGVSFPGIPEVISGHNGKVAWGFTNGFPDVQDLYIEHLRRTAEAGVQVEYKGEWYDAQVIAEEIKVKGGEAVIEEVIVTRHGPIINSLAPDLAGPGLTGDDEEDPQFAEGLALRWTSLEADNMLDGLHAMNRARNCHEFREALRPWTSPTQNTVYADTEGNIGYSFPGKVPIRAKGTGRVPVPGWTDEYEWTGYLPFEELPHLYNPPQGYVATANNRVVDDDYPHELAYDHCMGDRAQRIVELIEAQSKIDVAYIQQMHFDQVSPTGRIVGRHLGRLEVDDPELVAVVELMRSWDGTLTADSPAAAVHQVFLRRMTSIMLQPKLGDLAARYAGKGPTPVLGEGSMFGEKVWTWLTARLDEPASHWFDLGRGESRDDVMRLALHETVEFLREELGPEIDDWAWGKLHTLTFTHTLGAVKPLDRLFNRGPHPLGGDGTTVWAAAPAGGGLGAETIIGPPFRFIADLGDLRNSWGLLAPGQSGQPGSKHYDDQAEAWFKGKYHPMLYDLEDVEREAEACLRLVPDKEE